MKVQQEFNMTISKTFAYENMKTSGEIVSVLEEHVNRVKTSLVDRIPNIVYCLTREIVEIYDSSVSYDGDLKLEQHSRASLYIPGLIPKKYNSYRQQLKITLFVNVREDLNLLKIRNYPLYSQCFDQFNKGHLSANIISTVNHTIMRLQYSLDD